MNPDVVQGLAQAVLPSSLAATAVGVVLGLVVGMIPGMTISSGIIIVLPLTFVLDPNISIALLLGLYVAGMTGGSFAAILLNIPGTPSASATAMDGYPMTRAGVAGRALGISITAGFAAACSASRACTSSPRASPTWRWSSARRTSSPWCCSA